MYRALLLSLVACSQPRSAPAAQASAGSAAEVAGASGSEVVEVSAPAKVASAPGIEVVEVIARIDECSGAGGEHYVLRLPDGRIAHAGGHARFLGLTPGTASTPTYLVAELVYSDPDQHSNPAWSRAGWCLGALPSRFDAVAVRFARARDRADAERLLARVAAGEPLPPSP